MTTAAPRISYPEVLEQAGFYRRGQPLPDLIWSAAEMLRAPSSAGEEGAAREQIERAFRYQAVLRPEDAKGRLGVTDVYELSGSPCIYFKRVDRDLEAERLTAALFSWHRAAWNHGQAPMLWVVTPTQVRILDAYARPPTEPDPSRIGDIEIRRFERIADQLEELRALASRQEIESGRFWRGAGRSIDRKNRVDRQLIQDLSKVAERLGSVGLELGEAHRLLLRAIFASYLEARGWLPPRRLPEAVGVEAIQDALRAPRAARRLFTWLAETFNGDVFPHGGSSTYSAAQLKELRFFLRGGDPETGQRYLWPYEFDVIPVELLSSIYEEFTHALDPASAKSRSTHYTPMNLVELTLGELFDDELFEDELPADARILDLACGSGVFLVEALRRLVSRRVAAGERLTRKLIRNTLYQQVFGVDLSGGAVHIAAVSLYLAALELDPNPHLGNGVKFKPLIYGKDPGENSKRRFYNLFEAGAFDMEAVYRQQEPFARKSFAAVVGNPPWTRPRGVRAGAGAAAAEQLDHVSYCRERGIPLPSQDPPDQAFVWRAADFASDGGRLGFILSGRRFFSHHADSVAARQALLGRFVPRMMINLASLHREDVFPTAKHPGMIYVAANFPSPPRSTFTFITLERYKAFKNHGTIAIGPELVKKLSVRRAIREKDFLKIASWGGARDACLIEDLRSWDSLGKILDDLGIEPRPGFIRGKERNRTRPVDRRLLQSAHSCLEKEGFRPFDLDLAPLPTLEDERMERPRDAMIYRGPLLLVKLGLGTRGLEATFCEGDVVYSQRYYGVQIPSKLELWRSCLNGILNSGLATYFLFLTASEWGVERDNIPGNDIFRLPVPRPAVQTESAARRLSGLVDELRRAVRREGRTSDAALTELDDAVFDLYGLDADQRALVKDMVHSTVDLQRKAEFSVEMLPPVQDDLASYAEAFNGVSNQLLRLRKRLKMVAEIFELQASAPVRVVKFRIVDRADRSPRLRTIAIPELEGLMERIAGHLPASRRGLVHVRRHLRVYAPGELYVMKPAERRFWTRSAAFHDADTVMAEHLRSW